MPAVRIEWKTRADERSDAPDRSDESGGREPRGRREVRAERVGRRWSFSSRAGRYDNWGPWADPPLEQWRELLDGVRRRVQRGLLQREEEKRLLTELRERFPGVEWS
jgi:hypothetical protein